MENFEEKDFREQFDEPVQGRPFIEEDIVMKMWIAHYVSWRRSVDNIESVFFFINPENYGEYLTLKEFINRHEPEIDVDVITDNLQFIDNLSIYKFT